jgi:uncharacterized protein (TIRG00374 family)
VAPRLKTFLQYALILAVTTLLIWFSLRNLEVTPGNQNYNDKWSYLLYTWNSASKSWLILMGLIVMVSHIIRAERWRMLIEPSGNKTTLGNSFLSLMIGYLVNLVIPRGGEISRCYNLYKLDKTPVEISFGTVVVERMVDVICLLLLISLSFIAESKKLFLFIDSLPIGSGDSRVKFLLIAFAAIIVLIAIFIWLFKTNKKVHAFFLKPWIGFKEGLLSVFKLKRKGLFIFYSAAIWFLYFLSSYSVIQAFPETSHLGFGAMLSLFAIGSIAMTVPLPGGMGSYHVLVPQGLIFLYHVSPANAVAFVFIFHGWQTAIMIAGGAISLLITSYLVKKRQAAVATKTPEN